MVKKIFVFDTETNGLGAYAEIIQLGGVLLLYDTDSGELSFERGINLYCQPTTPIRIDATRVHRISNRDIANLSHGKQFFEYMEELKDILFDFSTLYVGFNVRFDIRILNQTLKRNGYRELEFDTNDVRCLKEYLISPDTGRRSRPFFDVMYSTMREFNIQKSGLADMYRNLITPNRLESIGMYKEYCDALKVKPLSRVYDHDAFFDTYMTLRLMLLHI